MKIKLMSLCAAVGIVLTGRAEESFNGQFYAKLDIGAAMQGEFEASELLGVSLSPEAEIETDTGIRLGVAGGYKFTDCLAAELESGFALNSIDSIGGISVPSGVEYDIYQVPVLANLVYTFPVKGKIKLYAGAGAGGVFMILDGYDGGDVNEDDFVWAWQVQAGVDFQFCKSLKAGLGYKLLGTGETEWSGLIKTDSVLTHSVFASITLTF